MAAANRVRATRKAADMTQQELAEQAGTARQTIFAIETTDYNPSIELALRIAAALDEDVGDLFWLED